MFSEPIAEKKRTPRLWEVIARLKKELPTLNPDQQAKALEFATQAVAEEKKPDESDGNNETTTPKQLFETLLPLVNVNNLKGSGIYTEIHVEKDGIFFITPDIMTTDDHWATETGSHSMWDTWGNAVMNGTQPLEKVSAYNDIQKLGLNNTTYVAKGRLQLNETGNLILNITRFQKSKMEEKALLFNLVKFKDNFPGIKEFTTEDEVIDITKVDVDPRYNTSLGSAIVEYVFDPELKEGDPVPQVLNGFATELRTAATIRENSTTDPENTLGFFETHTLNFNILQGQMPTHTDVASAATEKRKEIYKEHFEEKNIIHSDSWLELQANKTILKVQLRHRIDINAKTISFDLMVQKDGNKKGLTPEENVVLAQFLEAYITKIIQDKKYSIQSWKNSVVDSCQISIYYRDKETNTQLKVRKNPINFAFYQAILDDDNDNIVQERKDFQNILQGLLL